MARLQQKEIVFDYPVKVGDKEVSSITMRRQKVQDSVNAETMVSSKADSEMEVALFSLLCSIPMEDILDWDFKDYQKLQEGYLFLMEGDRRRILTDSDKPSSASRPGPDGAEQK